MEPLRHVTLGVALLMLLAVAVGCGSPETPAVTVRATESAATSMFVVPTSPPPDTPTPTPARIETPPATPIPAESPTSAPAPLVATPAPINLGNVECPAGGQTPRPGLARFGAFIATWQVSGYRRDATYSSRYTNDRIPGYISVRCSRDFFVVVEVLWLNKPVSFQQALQLALDELPLDAIQVYDHPHPSCRILQFRSPQLAAQLGRGNADGVVNVDLESPVGSAYSSDSIGQVHIDILDRVNEDTGC